MNCPYNKSHTGSEVVQKWMDEYFRVYPFNQKITPFETDIYVICFNNPFLVEYQIETLKNFYKGGNFNIIIVDNNCYLHPSCSRQYQELCEYYNVIYLQAPANIYQTEHHFDTSLKLGCTLNWLFYNVIKTREPEYFFMLDHDAMIFRDFDKRRWLDEMGVYGTVCRNLPAWNIHVTQFGAKFDYVKDLALDFRPSWKYSLDTGGSNYEVLYSQLRMEDYMLINIGYRFFKEDSVSGIRPQHYEIIDNCWIHLCSSSHDQLAGDGQRKLDYFKGFLDRCLMD